MVFRLLKRRKAVKTYVFKLPLELQRRFGNQKFYSLEQVQNVLELGKFDQGFSAYAYALLCSRQEFDSHFGQLKLKCTYDSLRSVIAKRYFKGVSDFEGGAVVRFARESGTSSYYESKIGYDA